MCGIFAYVDAKSIGPQLMPKLIQNFEKIGHRGPDSKKFVSYDKVFFGFHRLRINDLSENGDQPFESTGVSLICNGEIYNHKDIIRRYNLETNSNSDCEVILSLYNHLKNKKFITSHSRKNVKSSIMFDDTFCVEKEIMIRLCNELDGEFAGILYDTKLKQVIAFRDPYGVRPLYIGIHDDKIFFASELKAINDLSVFAEQFIPGCVMVVKNNGPTLETKTFSYTNNFLPSKSISNRNYYTDNIRHLLFNAVNKRLMSDRPVCALLSGGLDSSLVCAIASRILSSKMQLETFSIGLEGSTDLKYAQTVADFIGSKHHNVIMEKQDFLEAIPEVIRIIESYDVTTVRASVGNYLVAKYIRENTDNIVVLNGDYSDEVTGGYIYLKKAPDCIDFSDECKRLVDNICFFDSLRSDRTICSQGLEARVPFSDKEFVEFYQSIPPEIRFDKNRIEKHLLREAFDLNYLPQDVLYRKKEAFSDGVSSTTESWHTIITNWVNDQITDEEFKNKASLYIYNKPTTKEAYYYRTLFDKFYSHPYVIPYFWMPQNVWLENPTNDPSARTLDIY